MAKGAKRHSIRVINRTASYFATLSRAYMLTVSTYTLVTYVNKIAKMAYCVSRTSQEPGTLIQKNTGTVKTLKKNAREPVPLPRCAGTGTRVTGRVPGKITSGNPMHGC